MLHKNITNTSLSSKKIPIWGWAMYVLILSASFLCFQHTDLIHTFSSSYAYLNGHYLDFYDYNKHHIGGNDYLPLIYGIFAIWNLPLNLLGLLPSPEFIGPARFSLEIFWSKLLLVCFFFSCVQLLSLITKELSADSPLIKNRPVAILFASSPIAVLIVFAFGQYDVIGLFFVLAAYVFYLKKKMWPFALLFSVAISFKYFALVIYIPLLLMVEKRPLKILKWLAVAGVMVGLQVLLYAHSNVFLGEIFTLFKTKVVGPNQDRISFSKPTFYMAALYLAGCIYLYLKRYTSKHEWQRDTVFVPIIAYGLMFSAVVWHPQWLVIAMPFFALSYLYISNAKLLAFADVMGAFSFIWIFINVWANNVDMNMMQKSIVAQYLPNLVHSGSDFLTRTPLKFFGVIFYSYLFFPAILYMLEIRSKKFSRETELSNGVLFARFFLGVSPFLLLALACLAWF